MTDHAKRRYIIVVDRDRCRLHVVDPGEGGADPKRVRSCQIAVGMEGFETPPDEYKTGNRSRTPDWQAPKWADPPLVPGRIYEFGAPFNPYEHGLIQIKAVDKHGEERTGYAMHGTKNEASIPGHASHGCIRMKEKDIKWMYEHIPENTLVIIR